MIPDGHVTSWPPVPCVRIKFSPWLEVDGTLENAIAVEELDNAVEICQSDVNQLMAKLGDPDDVALMARTAMPCIPLLDDVITGVTEPVDVSGKKYSAPMPIPLPLGPLLLNMNGDCATGTDPE